VGRRSKQTVKKSSLQGCKAASLAEQFPKFSKDGCDFIISFKKSKDKYDPEIKITILPNNHNCSPNNKVLLPEEWRFYLQH
jgi:hypothetical protein